MSWTKVAESYPAGVCTRLPAAVNDAAASSSRTVSTCVRDSSPRIGEAENPGPRQLARQRQGSLFDVELIEAQTVRMRTRIWDVFKAWLRERLSEATVLAVFRCHPLLGLVLRDYADELYKTGA